MHYKKKEARHLFDTQNKQQHKPCFRWLTGSWFGEQFYRIHHNKIKGSSENKQGRKRSILLHVIVTKQHQMDAIFLSEVMYKISCSQPWNEEDRGTYWFLRARLKPLNWNNNQVDLGESKGRFSYISELSSTSSFNLVDDHCGLSLSFQACSEMLYLAALNSGLDWMTSKVLSNT